MTISIDVAAEHLRDGEDNIKECLKTIRRVQKNFPSLGPELDVAVTQLNSAKATICDASKRLAAP